MQWLVELVSIDTTCSTQNGGKRYTWQQEAGTCENNDHDRQVTSHITKVNPSGRYSSSSRGGRYVAKFWRETGAAGVGHPPTDGREIDAIITNTNTNTKSPQK